MLERHLYRHHFRIRATSSSSSSSCLHTTSIRRGTRDDDHTSRLGPEEDGRSRPTFFTSNNTTSTSKTILGGRARSPAFSRPSLIKLGGIVPGSARPGQAYDHSGAGGEAGGKPYSGGPGAGADAGSSPAEGSGSGAGARGNLLPESFRSKYYHPTPEPPATPHYYTTSLASHLLVSFLPSHTNVPTKHPKSDKDKDPQSSSNGRRSPHAIKLQASPSPNLSKKDPPTLALVCPIEGSESHTLETTLNAAGLVGADVVQLDLVRTVGLGVEGDWGKEAGGFVKLGMGNPVLVKDESEIRGSAAGSGSGSGSGVGIGGEGEEEVDGWEDKEYDPEEDGHVQSEEDGEEGEEHEDEHEGDDDAGNSSHVISGPFEIAIPVGGNPGGLGGGGGGGRTGMGMMAVSGGGQVGIGMDEPRDVGSEVDKEGMRRVFQELVDLDGVSGQNGDAEQKTKPRIIFVQHSTAMNASFSSWWWALTRAVRLRNASGKPTTIVLSCTPSFLHLGPNLSLPAPAAPAEPAENPGLPPGLGELMKAMKRMREGPGGGAGGQGKKEDEFWKGSEEEDKVGRRKRLRKRLAGFQLGDERCVREFVTTNHRSGLT